MKIASISRFRRAGLRAFTIAELLVASSVGLVITGGAMSLLYTVAQENLRGLGGASVEEKAYVLQSTVTKQLRVMSANMGMSPDYNTAVYDSAGDLLGYHGIYVFSPSTNGTYTTERIVYTNGLVSFYPKASATTRVTWFSNSPSTALTNMWFSQSLNPDGSLNGSLVNVRFEMTDNGFSRHSTTNNPACVYRCFAVQMRSN